MDSIARLREAASALPSVRLAAVFGSTARGTAGAESDLDLLLAVDPDTLESRRDAIVALGRAARRDLDVVHAAEAPPQLRFEIARDGVLLAEREPGLWTDFKARAMVDWWDWAPYARRMHAAAISQLRERVRRGEA